MQTDVLIVGAGPTGLMLANQLGRRGLKPLIIDRHAGPAEQTRAMAVHARTLEIYAKMGLCGRGARARRAGDRRQHVVQWALERAHSAWGHRARLEPIPLRPHAWTG